MEILTQTKPRLILSGLFYPLFIYCAQREIVDGKHKTISISASENHDAIPCRRGSQFKFHALLRTDGSIFIVIRTPRGRKSFLERT